MRTLRNRFRRELDRGRARLKLKLGQTLTYQALNGNTAALIFASKCWLGMRETARHELVGADGAPLMAPEQPQLTVTTETLELRHHPLDALRREIERREREPGDAAVH